VDVKKHFDLCFCRILADFAALSRDVLNLVFKGGILSDLKTAQKINLIKSLQKTEKG